MVKPGADMAGLLLAIIFCLVLTAVATAQTADDERALIRYYVQSARKTFRMLDMRQRSDPFEALLVTRRFTLESNGDTTQLDTAVIKASYRIRRIWQSNPDSLFPDRIEILQSSFLEETPGLPALFFPPPWQVELDYSLYPNDPGVGDFAVGYNTHVTDGDTSRVSDGLFLIDRSSGRLKYLLKYYLDENGNSRSAEYIFGEDESALIPQRVVEHMTRGSVARSGYFIIETYLLDMRLK